MARHFFAERDPIGARISNNNGQTWTTIVGVVGDVRRSLDASPSDALYVPLAQGSPLTVMYLMRTAGHVSGSLPGQAREALYSIDPNQPADQFRTLDQVRSQSVEAPRLTAILMGLFAGLALAITAAGLGGVIAFSVNQRTQEFGVRMALGASRSSLLRMVLTQALKLVADRPGHRWDRRLCVRASREDAALQRRTDRCADVCRRRPGFRRRRRARVRGASPARGDGRSDDCPQRKLT